VSDRDFYYRLPSPLAWNILEVEVREVSGVWEFAFGYQLPTCGLLTPFRGPLPSRDAAGRNGLLFLRDALRRVASDSGSRCLADQRDAGKYAAAIQEFLFPSQPDFFDLLERGAA